jgi:hypothetical protein
MNPASLVCHPATPCSSVGSLCVSAERDVDLVLRFRLEGEMEALAIPALATPAFADRLWEHTCFEVFAGHVGDEGDAYHELNFSPSGEWARWAFSGYRRRADDDARAQSIAAPRASWRREPNALALDVRIDLASLGSTAGATLRLGLTAVIEERSGRRSYWALRHDADAPDFHDARSFALLLSPARGG